jgi:hypothetical protein
MRKYYLNLTLSDYIKLNSGLFETDFDRDIYRLSIVLKCSVESLKALPYEKIVSLSKELTELEKEDIKGSLKNRIKVGSKWFFADYRLTKLTAGQFIDVSSIVQQDLELNIHKLLACFFTPLFWRFANPIPYDGGRHKEVSEDLLQMKIKDAYPIMVFFCRYLKESSEAIPTYLKEVNQELKTHLLKNGDGL